MLLETITNDFDHRLNELFLELFQKLSCLIWRDSFWIMPILQRFIMEIYLIMSIRIEKITLSYALFICRELKTFEVIMLFEGHIMFLRFIISLSLHYFYRWPQQLKGPSGRWKSSISSRTVRYSLWFLETWWCSTWSDVYLKVLI